MTDSSASTLPGASELMRSLGLLVDGPAVWGKAVSSRRPGVFVVEFPGGAERAPIDIVAVRRWVEHVPDMLLDRQPASAPEVARRLEAFWLPREPILYVGRSARAIGQRVVQMFATPLGDAKPYSGGQWLQTLSVVRDLRIWWAETDAHEEYEDALLSAVAGRVSADVKAGLPDPNIVLPFANLATPAGDRKPHGIANSIRAEEASTGPGANEAKAKRRTTSVSRAGASGARQSVPRSKSTRPAPEPTYVSRDGLSNLTAELDQLRGTVRPQVIARVKAARELGDLKENADYEYARKEQSFVEGRIQTIEQMIKTSVLIDETATTDAARIGSTVVVETAGKEATYLLVGPAEADPGSGRISHVSPVGRALIGARPGDEVVVQLPSGSVGYRVLEVR
jgi:transcription elongation factor GreA